MNRFIPFYPEAAGKYGSAHFERDNGNGSNDSGNDPISDNDFGFCNSVALVEGAMKRGFPEESHAFALDKDIVLNGRGEKFKDYSTN